MHWIKFIRAVRVCKTPALGGHKHRCKSCGHERFIYHSCGHSQCPLCQSIKRAQWQDRLRNKLLKVPYTHTVFTIPHQLNGLARRYPAQMYNVLLRSAWQTVKHLSDDPANLGALPGMVAVLHTFGSDMKFHLHAHCLITFGGLNNGQWIWPKRKRRLARYEKMCATFREIFLKKLDKLVHSGSITTSNYEQLRQDITHIRWNVRSSHPSMHTEQIEQYLARYINRVAISKNRLIYLEQQRQVAIIYNDYKKQLPNQPAPKAVKLLSPLLAIHNIVQHVLPPYFQKSRHYGLHSSATFKQCQALVPNLVRANPHTIRTVFQILYDLLKIKPFVCDKCQSVDQECLPIPPDTQFLKLLLHKQPPRSPPNLRITGWNRP